jgi:hypothetical protein
MRRPFAERRHSRVKSWWVATGLTPRGGQCGVSASPLVLLFRAGGAVPGRQ